MVERAGGARFVIEARLVLVGVILLHRHVYRLHGDGALQDQVGRLEHYPHGAAPDFRFNDVTPELRLLHAESLTDACGATGRA